MSVKDIQTQSGTSLLRDDAGQQKPEMKSVKWPFGIDLPLREWPAGVGIPHFSCSHLPPTHGCWVSRGLAGTGSKTDCEGWILWQGFLPVLPDGKWLCLGAMSKLPSQPRDFKPLGCSLQGWQAVLPAPVGTGREWHPKEGETTFTGRKWWQRNDSSREKWFPFQREVPRNLHFHSGFTLERSISNCLRFWECVINCSKQAGNQICPKNGGFQLSFVSAFWAVSKLVCSN